MKGNILQNKEKLNLFECNALKLEYFSLFLLKKSLNFQEEILGAILEFHFTVVRIVKYNTFILIAVNN